MVPKLSSALKSMLTTVCPDKLPCVLLLRIDVKFNSDWILKIHMTFGIWSVNISANYRTDSPTRYV